jgi:hypothetical protein
MAKCDHIYWSTRRIFGERDAEFWTMSYRFFINIGPNNYSKVTNVDINQLRKFWISPSLDIPRGRNGVQKIKWTPDYQTELDGESKKK